MFNNKIQIKFQCFKSTCYIKKTHSVLANLKLSFYDKVQT